MGPIWARCFDSGIFSAGPDATGNELAYLPSEKRFKKLRGKKSEETKKGEVPWRTF